MEKNRAVPAVFLNQPSGVSLVQENKAVSEWELGACKKVGLAISRSSESMCTTCCRGIPDDCGTD